MQEVWPFTSGRHVTSRRQSVSICLSYRCTPVYIERVCISTMSLHKGRMSSVKRNIRDAQIELLIKKALLYRPVPQELAPRTQHRSQLFACQRVDSSAPCHTALPKSAREAERRLFTDSGMWACRIPHTWPNHEPSGPSTADSKRSVG